MKKTLISAIAVALASASSPAFSDDSSSEMKNSLYLGAGITDTVLDDDNIAIKFGYNRNLSSVLSGLSVDVELSKSIADASSNDQTDVELLPNPDPAADLPYEISYTAVGAFARYDVTLEPLAPGVGVYTRVGSSYSYVELAGESDNSFDVSYGGGLTYRISPGFSVFADYTQIEGDADLKEVSIGIKASY